MVPRGGAFGSLGVRYRVHSGLRPRMVGVPVSREVGAVLRANQEMRLQGGALATPATPLSLGWTTRSQWLEHVEHQAATGDEAGGDDVDRRDR